jgi:hypothetical protein
MAIESCPHTLSWHQRSITTPVSSALTIFASGYEQQERSQINRSSTWSGNRACAKSRCPIFESENLDLTAMASFVQLSAKLRGIDRVILLNGKRIHKKINRHLDGTTPALFP